jgi:N-methylhydantoinase A
MERAIRAISLERGYDPRRFTLVPFGGAGPMHCCELAQELGIPRVLVPGRPGILSALGVAIADVVKDYSRTVMLRGEDLNRVRMDEEFLGLEGLARRELESEDLPVERMTARRFLDVRYLGQSFELTIDYPGINQSNGRSNERTNDQGPALRRRIADSFYRAHLQRFGYADRGEPIEIVNLRLKLDLAVDKPDLQLDTATASDLTQAQIATVSVVFREGELETPLYQRDLLSTGDQVAGPALVVQLDTTTVIPPGWQGEMDVYGNLLLAMVNG